MVRQSSDHQLTFIDLEQLYTVKEAKHSSPSETFRQLSRKLLNSTAKLLEREKPTETVATYNNQQIK